MSTYRITEIPGKPTTHVLIAGTTYREAILNSGIEYMGKNLICRQAGAHAGFNLGAMRLLDQPVAPDALICIVGPASGSGPLPDEATLDESYRETLRRIYHGKSNIVLPDQDSFFYNCGALQSEIYAAFKKQIEAAGCTWSEK